jgi:hypothetical protein
MSQVMHFFAWNRRDTPRLPWFKPVTSPRAKKPPLPLHHTLICVHMLFWFYSYYTTPSVNRFLGTKRIQIKTLSTTKFHNCPRSTTFTLGVFSFEVIYEIRISNLRDSNFEFHWQYDFKLTSCKLQSFLTSDDLLLSCWEFLHFRSFEKFKFSNLKNTDVLYFNKSNSNKQWFNYKIL